MRKILLAFFLLTNYSIFADEINKMSLIDGNKAEEVKNYSKQTCQEIYYSIGIFLYLEDEKWEKENKEKGILYSIASANYSTIFQTQCKKPKIINTQNPLDEELLDIYYKMPTFLLDD